MFKKINALISTKQKIALIFIFFGNFLITGLEFLSLASIPLIISLIISPDFIESNIPIFKLFIENLIFEKGNYKNLFVLIFFLFLIKNLFLGIILFLEAKFAFNLRTSLTNKLFKKYLEMPYLFHANSNPGKLIRNVVVEVTGGDFLDKTPVYDLKPYVPYVDCVNNATSEWALEKEKKMPVRLENDALLDELNQNQQFHYKDKKDFIFENLALDPRPAHERGKDGKLGQTWGVRFSDFDVKWKVEQGTCIITSIVWID